MTLTICGLIILATQLVISWLSHSFVFGWGHQERPILEFLLLEGIAFAAYFAAVEWVRRRSSFLRSSRFIFWWILSVALLCRLFLLPSQLIQETDPYRYIWDGQSVLQGANPYEHSPREAFWHKLPPADKPEAEVLEIFQKISHSGIRTIYPPLAQSLFTFSQWFTPWKLGGWKGMILIVEIGILGLLFLVFRRLKMSETWLLLYAWSPLALKEFSNSLHVDVFAILFLCAMMLAIAHQRFILSYVFLALAALTKFFPLVLLPVLFAWTYRQNKKESLTGLAAFLGIAGLFYLPFVGAGSQLFEGLGRFAGEWRVNEGLFGVIRHTLTFFGAEFFQAEVISRILAGAGVLTATYLVIRWFWESHNTADFFKACAIILASLFFLAPTGNPWYFTWVLPFLAFFPLRSLILFSGLVLLYYLDFYLTYQGTPRFFAWVRVFEYGIFYLFLGWELWEIKSPLFYRSQTKELLSAIR